VPTDISAFADIQKITRLQDIEVSIKGIWTKVPAIVVGDKAITIRGSWMRVAAVHDEEWLATEVDDPNECISRLKNGDMGEPCADIFTFTQKVPGAPVKYDFPFEWMSIAAIKLANFDDWWLRLPQETRKNVRRAAKRGVVTSIQPFDDTLIAGISEVNNDSPMRQGIRNHHYGKSPEQIRKDYSAFGERSDFICAYFRNEIIGFLKLVYRGDVASILNLTTKASHSDKRPANALVCQAVQLCEAKGVSHVTYGQFNYGNKRQSPLLEFKIRNGFEEMLKPRYYIPLTHRGRLYLKANLHRGLLGILPNSVIQLGLSIRSRCYNLKHIFKPV
jgi:hypothetical protein